MPQPTVDTLIAALNEDTFTVTSYDTATLTATKAHDLNLFLLASEHVSVDIETVYDGNDLITITNTPDSEPVTGEQSPAALAAHTVADGTDITYKRNLVVDGPGATRVVTVSGLHDNTLFTWLFDCRDLNMDLLATVFTGVHAYAWNADFDRPNLARDNVTLTWFDLMLADATLRTGTTGGDLGFYSSLSKAAKRWLGVDMTGKTDTRLSYNATDDLTEEQIRYAGFDAAVTTVLGVVLTEKLTAKALMPTWLRNNSAQAFIFSMQRNGLPFDTTGYTTQVINPARDELSEANETIALLTSGATMLTFVGTQARNAGIGDTTLEDEELGKTVLHDRHLFTALCEHLVAVAETAREQIAVCAGGTVLQEDLFSSSSDPVTIAPFDVNSDTDIRKWLSGQAPLFAAAIVAASVHPEVSFDMAVDAAMNNPAQLHTWAGDKKRITAGHPLDTLVLPALATTSLADVTDTLRDIAAKLLVYRQTRAFLDEYSHVSAPVRLQPDWKVGSSPAAKKAFNTYDSDHVYDYMSRSGKGRRLFETADPLDADTLTLIGSELSEAMLKWRHFDTLVNGWGEKFLTNVHPVTGRIHSSYLQAVTGTHRLNSRNPNAQNFSPVVKPFMRPSDTNRVLACADLSQAELRYLASVSGDVNMITAFASGEDLHERTAGLMFQIDMKMLKTLDSCPLTITWNSDGVSAAVDQDVDTLTRNTVDTLIRSMTTPDTSLTALSDFYGAAKVLYKTSRQKAKKVSFGYVYGIGARKLANDLSVDGMDTSPEEAAELIELFNQAYPQAAIWMKNRVDYITDVAGNIHHGKTELDWAASWKLHWGTKQVSEARKKLGPDARAEQISAWMVSDEQLRARIARRHNKTVEQVTDAEFDAARAQHTETVIWVTSHDVPSVLTPTGDVWMFTSVTAGGTIRHFPVLTSDWEWGMVSTIVKARDPQIKALREQWVVARNEAEAQAAATKRAAGAKVESKPPVTLVTSRGPKRPLSGKELEKQFDGLLGRERRTDLVEHVVANAPAFALTLYRMGMADRVRAMVNQYRNHPIQGGVADAVLDAMGEIHQRLVVDFPTAAPVQSVHDSIVIECDRSNARDVLDVMVVCMEAGLSKFAPNVVTKADGDIQLSLDDKTAIADDVDLLVAA